MAIYMVVSTQLSHSVCNGEKMHLNQMPSS